MCSFQVNDNIFFTHYKKAQGSERFNKHTTSHLESSGGGQVASQDFLWTDWQEVEVHCFKTENTFVTLLAVH